MAEKKKGGKKKPHQENALEYALRAIMGPLGNKPKKK